MKAAILTAYGEPLSVEDVTLGDLGPRGVRVHIEASGVCHSDLSAATGAVPIGVPMILGHEGAGTVLAVGPEVTRVQPGDHVIASFVPACGDCWFCLHDQSQLCEGMGAASYAPKGTRPDGTPVRAFTGLGTFAEEMLVDESAVVRVQTELPADQLALIGCGVTTGVGAALNTAQVTPGSTVAVIGCGGVGQSVIQGARIAGAARIFAIDPVAMKRETAARLGATDLVDPAAGDPVQQVKDATGGRGADYAFEVIGLPETITQAYATARRGGTVVVVGMARSDATVTFSAMSLFYEGKRILGCVYGGSQVRRDFPRFVQLAETGRLDLGALVTRHIHLDEVDDAFRAMQAGEVIRSVIV
ncbi:MAG: Zn-dependent alcohol dehydrogenase [Acidimicrobiia bacterium]